MEERYTIVQLTIDHGQLVDVVEQADFGSLEEARRAWDEGRAAGRFASDEGYFVYGMRYEIVRKSGGRYLALEDGAPLPWP